MHYTAAQVAQELGVTGQTVRNWIKYEWVTPAYIDHSEYPLFTEEQVEQFKAALPIPAKKDIKAWCLQFPRVETVVEEPTVLQIIPKTGKFAPKPDPDSKIANLINNSSVMLLESLTHIPCDLDNVADVVKYTEEYFHFCAELGMMPSKRRLANWMGYSLRVFEDRINNNSKTGKYIEAITDAIKDNLEQAALHNKVNNRSAIFLLKSQYGYVEANKVILEPSQNALGTPKSVEEIEEAIDNDIVED